MAARWRNRFFACFLLEDVSLIDPLSGDSIRLVEYPTLNPSPTGRRIDAAGLVNMASGNVKEGTWVVMAG